MLSHASRQLPSWLIFDVRQKWTHVIILFPFFVLAMVAFLYRHELGLRALAIYGVIWIVGLSIVLVLDLSPGVFVAAQCLLAIVILIHVRANPEVPRL